MNTGFIPGETYPYSGLKEQLIEEVFNIAMTTPVSMIISQSSSYFAENNVFSAEGPCQRLHLQIPSGRLLA